MTNPFPPATHADWLAQVQKDLKDPAVYDSLRWNTPDGFVAEPYYTAEHAGTLPLTDVAAAQRTQPGWLNAPAYTIDPSDGSNPRTDNATLLDALANGADALALTVEADVNLSLLLNGIKLSETPIFFTVRGDVGTFLSALRQVTPYQIKGGVRSVETQETRWEITADSPQFRVIHIDGSVFHNAGATATQELAFTLAQLADTADQLTETGLSIDQIAAKTTLHLAVGTSYFLEIAKLRALRVLLMRFSRGYVPEAKFPLPFLLHCTTSPFYESTATPYTNLLRATTEAMAAVVGGADVLTVRPYDAVSGAPTEFSQRIARNVSSLLRHESYLDKVADPSAGSYYIEALTHQLTEAAWALFLTVEQQGGWANALATGYVQQHLDEAFAAKVEAVQAGRVLVGVTKFRHDEGNKPIRARRPRPDLTGLEERRLAEGFE